MEIMKWNYLVKSANGVTFIIKYKYAYVIAIFGATGLALKGSYLLAAMTFLPLTFIGWFSETRIEIDTKKDTVSKGWFLLNKLIWNSYQIHHFAICSFEIENVEDYSNLNLVSDDKKYFITSFPTQMEAEESLNEIRSAIKN